MESGGLIEFELIAFFDKVIGQKHRFDILLRKNRIKQNTKLYFYDTKICRDNDPKSKFCYLTTGYRYSFGMGECISMSISGDSPSGETLNRGLCHCSCGDSMNFPLG